MSETFKEQLFIDAISRAYDNSSFCRSGATGETCEPLECFHMKEVYLVERDDDYFCGIRADHFCVEIGTTEEDPLGNVRDHTYCVVTANHKGQRMWCMFNLD